MVLPLRSIGFFVCLFVFSGTACFSLILCSHSYDLFFSVCRLLVGISDLRSLFVAIVSPVRANYRNCHAHFVCGCVSYVN